MEQTLARFVPTSLTARMLRRLDVPTADFDAELDRMMQAGLDRLLRFQHASGGWGWWCEDGDDPFMTARVVDGLTACRETGYDLDDVALERGRVRLRGYLEAEEDADRRAYFAWALREVDEATVDRAADLSSASLALATLGLARSDHAAAAKLAEMLVSRIDAGHWTTRGWFRWPEIDAVSTAWAVRALHAVDPADPRIEPAVRWLLDQRSAGQWRSTLDTAIAAAALLEVLDLDELGGAVETAPAPGTRPRMLRRVGVRLDGGAPRELLVDLNDPAACAFEVAYDELAPGAHSLAFEATDEEAEFSFTAEVALSVVDPPDAPIASDRMEIDVDPERPLDRLRIGDEIEVAVTVRAAQAAAYVLVRSAIPAGCEVVRGSGAGPFSEFEARHDAALFFLDAVGPDPIRLTYRLRALHAGRYSVQPAWAGLMYDEAVHGTTAGGTAVVRD